MIKDGWIKSESESKIHRYLECLKPLTDRINTVDSRVDLKFEDGKLNVKMKFFNHSMDCSSLTHKALCGDAAKDAKGVVADAMNTLHENEKPPNYNKEDLEAIALLLGAFANASKLLKKKEDSGTFDDFSYDYSIRLLLALKYSHNTTGAKR